MPSTHESLEIDDEYSEESVQDAEPEAVVEIKDKTIGQVLSHLDAEFPGLSASKVRFLEDRGLVFPERTNTGYRKYSSADIRRLRYVLSLQRDQYLPLKVIKEKVDEKARQGGFVSDQQAEAPVEPSGHAPVAPALLRAEEGRSYTIRELSRHTSVSLQMLRELVNFGLISGDGEGNFDEYDATVVTLCARLTSYGLEPRHLRFFRAAADREIGLVQQSVAPLASRRDEESRERAAASAKELAEICTNLHATMVAGQVQRHWGS